ncbi:MAG: hypothetical protein AB7I42_24100 [Bradyrhizobium sp.]|uniref:hypothetical protein n=1 Tax=Bradyrhizobium sp. TaxID=376 RepID=UPI003D0FD5C6
MSEQPTKPLAVVTDEGDFAALLDSSRFSQLWRVATLYAGSALVPEHFRGKAEDCFITCQMAIRLGVDPFMMLQNTYVVHGKPGMSATLAIALINSSGIFSGGLQYERQGNDPNMKGYRVRAYAVRTDTGERIDGPWIDWTIVEAEGWKAKAGSKWKTIPALMFDYRAATWFGRLYCPERLMGMQTADELEDVGSAMRVESPERKQLKAPERKTVAVVETPPPPEDRGPTPPVDNPTYGPRMITEAQRKRLFAIAKDRSIPHEKIKAHLEFVHGIMSTADIPTEIYEQVCTWAENGGFEPGEEPT